MRRATPGLAVHVVLALVVVALVAGCGFAANGSAVVPSSPTQSSPPAAVTDAVAQTRGAIASALTSAGIGAQLGDATRPYRPAESARLRDAPRVVYQVVLPDQPDAGFIVVYEFPDTGSAVDAGNEEAGYLGTGPAKVQFPPDAQHVLQAVGTTLVLYTWSPTGSSDPTAGNVADALRGLGVAFSVPR
jgi:hypothetical protein